MKRSVAISLVICAAAATSAVGQSGLYGAPDVLNLPAMQSENPANPPAPLAVGPTRPIQTAYSGAYGYRATSLPPIGPGAAGPSQFAVAPSGQPPVAAQPAPYGGPVAPGPVPAYGPGGASCGAGPSCGTPACGAEGCNLWYGSVAGLYMTRNDANRFWTSFETDNNPNQVLNTNDADAGWGGGYELRLGRTFSCGQWAVEATWWHLPHLSGDASVLGSSYPAGSISTPMDFDSVSFLNDPTKALGDPRDWFDAVAEHRITRSDEFYNLEFNLVRNRMCDPGACGGLGIDWLVGIRWFHFREELTFSSLRFGGTWADPLLTASMYDRVINDLVGAQLGFNVNYAVNEKLRLVAVPKLGIYNNHISNYYTAYRGDGLLLEGPAGAYPVDSTSNSFAFLGQIDLGVNWQINENWEAFGGYRLIAVTGLALADHQIPAYVADVPEIASNHDNGDLILHGVFGGVTFKF